MTKRGIEELSFNGTLIDSSSIFDSSCDKTSMASHGMTNGVSDFGINGSNGHSYSNGASEENTVAKKFKSDISVPASAKSRVVHIRNIPSDTSQQELFLMASPFGNITNHLFVRSKNQAFVEFDSHFSAMQMASYWIQTTIGGVPTQVQPTIRGHHLQVQISNHKELKMHYENQNNSNTISSNGKTLPMENQSDTESLFSADNVTSNPGPVIKVLIDKQFYSIPLDSIYQTFSLCGKILKIITNLKNMQFQALIQFGDISSAINAKGTYDGQSVYVGNPIDFTVPKSNGLSRSINSTGSVTSHPIISNHASLSSESSDLSANIFNSTLAIPSQPTSFPSAAYSTFANAAALNINGQISSNPNLNAFNSRFIASGASSIHQALSAANAAALATGSIINPASAAMFHSSLSSNLVFTSVIHVSGLHPEHVTPDALFTLFGVYGDVIRVKILFNKKDTALIQMAEPSQAQHAITYLDRIRLFGKTIHVMASKHQIVQMPKEVHQDSGLTKDYTNSPLHRFKRPGSKNYNNIYPPSETLHVSNIPSSCTEEILKEAFQRTTEKEILKFKFFLNDHRMALIQFASIEDAIIALIKMHNYKVAENSHLRVSFSKSPI
ncbi:Polypyrimidine tract-binding protein 3 [Sarcoptes scabiei]|uniref:Polypyrimidine tract-binding protein 3 n=1 Tax=Sarcoptes scabiei TaxID=52283 RepID=A0A834RFK5_SARSC|nr:Polypyrimidine tract-binding protein 3 [Sarcoptes scabiei]